MKEYDNGSSYYAPCESSFEQAQDTQANRELKEEIQSNLTARIEDYVEQGMDEDRAFQNAIQHVAGLMISLPVTTGCSRFLIGRLFYSRL